MPIATTLLTHAETWLGRLDYLFKPGTVVLGAAAAFLCYRWRSKGETPILVCNDGFREFLERRCPAVKERYCPTPWCWGGRLQTLVRVVIKSSPHVTYRKVVVFNNRGFGGEELLTPVTFCAANTSDLEHVVSHIKQQLPQTPLMAAGVSLGGILLLNYLARMGRKSGLLAAFTVSVSWNTVESCASLEKPLNKILFNYHLASNLCQAITRHRKVLEPVIDVDYILKSRTIREFDERYTSVMFGYKTCKDYYHDASPFYKLPSTTIPVLCLNAADDPFSPEHTIPVESARRLPNVALVITARGGHVGFLEGFFPQGESYMDRLFGQFIWAVFEHGKDLAEMCITKN
ncbi:ABHD3 Phospholipase, partial [Polypterus senegalus]